MVSERGWQEVTVTTAIDIAGNIALEPITLALRTSNVVGTVTAEDDDVDVLGAVVVAVRTDSLRSRSVGGSPSYRTAAVDQGEIVQRRTVVSADGSYELDDVPSGFYDVIIQQQDAAPVRQEIEVTGDEATVTADPVAISKLSGDFVIVGADVAGTELRNGLTANPAVILSINSTGDGQIRVGEVDGSGVCQAGPAQALSASVAHTLSAGDGLKTICVELLDGNNAVIDELRSDVILDTTAPQLSLLRVNGGVEFSTVNTVLLEVVALDAGVGLASITRDRDGSDLGTVDYVPVFNDTVGADGSYTYTVTVIDRVGHESTAKVATVTVDSVAPTIDTFAINGGVSEVTPGAVSVALGGSDVSPLQMKLWIGDENSASYVPFVTGTTLNFPQQDGVFLVGLKLRDAAGNESAPQVQSVTIDFSPPQNPSVSINEGATVNSANVNLSLSAVDASQMRISQSPTFTGASWVAYATARAFILNAGDGVKTVYAQYRDDAGNESDIVSSQTVVDTTAPDLIVDAGVAISNDPLGQFNLSLISSGASHMRITSATGSCDASGASEVPFSSSIVHAYTNAGTGRDEVAIVCAQVRDTAGNWSASVSDTVQYDTSAPVAGGSPIVLAGGAAVTADSTVAVALDAVGADEMQISLDSGFAGASWVSYAATASIGLPAGDGTRSVYVRFRDAAGNTTLGSSDDVTVDQTGPVGFSLSGPSAVSSTSLSLTVGGTDPHGPVEVIASESADFSGASWAVLSGSVNITLGGGDGDKTVYVQLRDAVGNTSAVRTHSVSVDNTPPANPSLSVQQGDYVGSGSVSLVLGVEDASQVRLAASEAGLAAASWEPLALTKGFILSAGEGLNTVWAQYRDAADNRSANVSATTILDTVDPVVSVFTVNGGNANAAPGAVNVQIMGTDASPLQMKLWVDNEAAAAFGPYVTSTSVVIPAVDGAHTVGIKLKDAGGNISNASLAVLTVDSTPPSLASIAIAEGALTNATGITVSLSASGADEVRVSESPTLTGASWVATAGTLPFTLSAGDGVKTVYGQYRDNAGNESDVVSDSIVLDTAAPDLNSVTIVGGDTNADPAGQLTVNLLAIDSNGVDMMRVASGTGSCDASVASAVAYDSSVVHPYTNAGTGRDEVAIVCAQVRDTAGNWSAPVSDTVQYDTNAPVAGGSPIVLAGGAAVTADSTVAVALDAVGADEMQISLDSGFAGASWVSYAATASIGLPAGDGTRSVYVRFRDAAGNTTLGSSDDVTVDQTGPVGFSLSGPSAVSSTSLSLTAGGTDPHGPVEVIASENADFSGASWAVLSGSVNITLGAGDGDKTVYVQLRDAVGNTSAVRTHSVSVDNTLPANPSLSVQQGDYVGSSAVSLVLGVEDASQVRLAASEAGLSAASWEPLALTKGFTLSAGEGLNTVWAQYRDAADNRSANVSATTILDTVDPVVSVFTVNGGNANAAPGAVNVQIMGTDATPLQMKLWVDNEAAAAFGPYVTSTSVVIPAVDGAHTVGIKLKDAGGNISNASLAVLTVDSTPPSLASISIAEGALTNATGITVNLSASGADEVRVSESPTLTGASWVATAGTLPFTLSAGDGVKTVYAQYRDNAGNNSEIVSDSIVLDTAAPSVSSVLIDGGAVSNNLASGQMNLNLTGLDQNGIGGMKISSGADCSTLAAAVEEGFVTDKTITYSNAGAGQEETAYVCLQLKDTAGNWAAAVSDSIVYDTLAPTLSAFTLDGGNIVTTALTVNGAVSATGTATLMRISTGASCGNGLWEPFSSLRTVALAEGANSRSAQVQDAAGNLSACVPASITVDSVAPSLPTVSIAQTVTNNTTIDLTLSATDADLIEIAEDVGFLVPLYQGATVANTTVTLSVGEGTRSVYVRYLDNAGNISAIASDAVVIDTVAPAVSLLVNGGAATSNDDSGQFNLALSSLDAQLMRIHSGAGSCSAAAGSSVAFSTSEVHSYANAGSGRDEVAYVCVQVRDAAGNWSSEVSASIDYDTDAPVAGVPAITIESGAAVTNVIEVDLTIAATGADEMQVSLDAGFAGAVWQTYDTTASIQLPSGNGTRTAYVRFRDDAGNVTTGSNDDIDLDQSAPTGLSVVGPAAVSSTTVGLTITGSDANGVRVRLSEDASFSGASWTTLVGAHNFTISNVQGNHTIYVQLSDNLGNIGSVATHVVGLDNVAPSNPSAQISEDYSTGTATVILSADGASEVRLSENSDLSGASWEPVSLTKTFTLSAGEGDQDNLRPVSAMTRTTRARSSATPWSWTPWHLARRPSASTAATLAPTATT